MRVLLTNDDGIRAPGIIALYDALIARESLGITEILAVAPLTVQSATSHGITYDQPLMTKASGAETSTDPKTDAPVHHRIPGIAVDGRPADCTKLALTNLWPERYGEGSRPDLVISGMNMGANAGINVIYSGTVAAAIEAAFLGVPSIAVSMHLHRGTPDYRTGAAHAARTIERLIRGGLPDPHACLNINIPRCEIENASHADPIEPEVCPMNTHGLVDRYERRENPEGRAYYWPNGDGMEFRGADEGTDVERLFERAITVTPLSYNMTDEAAMEHWRARAAD